MGSPLGAAWVILASASSRLGRPLAKCLLLASSCKVALGFSKFALGVTSGELCGLFLSQQVRAWGHLWGDRVAHSRFRKFALVSWRTVWVTRAFATSRSGLPLGSYVDHSCVREFAPEVASGELCGSLLRQQVRAWVTSGEQCWSPPERRLLLASCVGHSCVCKFALGVTSGEQCGSCSCPHARDVGPGCVSKFALGVTSAQQRRSLWCSRSGSALGSCVSQPAQWTNSSGRGHAKG